MIYTAHHAGAPGAYTVIIKRGGMVVWSSPNTFHNRDFSTHSHRAARDVARTIIGYLELMPDKRDTRLRELDDFDIRRAASGIRVNRNESWFRQWCKEQADAIEATHPTPSPAVAGAREGVK